MADEGFLQVTEAATYLGVSAQTLRRWDRDSAFQALRQPEANTATTVVPTWSPFAEYGRTQEAAAAGGDSSVFATANADIEADARAA